MSTHMRRSRVIDGIDVVFSKSISGWVAVLGEGYAVHFLAPVPGRAKWLAKRPLALEPIALGKSLEAVFRMAFEHHRALISEVRRRRDDR